MEARAVQRAVRQSARKMRLVIDLIRGRPVPEAYAILRFSKKLAAKQINKVLKSAVANAEQHARRANEALDVDRFMPAAMGRGTPILKRTSHVEIRVASEPVVAAAPKAAAPAATVRAKPKRKSQPPVKRKAKKRQRSASAGATSRRGST